MLDSPLPWSDSDSDPMGDIARAGDLWKHGVTVEAGPLVLSDLNAAFDQVRDAPRQPFVAVLTPAQFRLYSFMIRQHNIFRTVDFSSLVAPRLTRSIRWWKDRKRRLRWWCYSHRLRRGDRW